jgi:LasA protease
LKTELILLISAAMLLALLGYSSTSSSGLKAQSSIDLETAVSRLAIAEKTIEVKASYGFATKPVVEVHRRSADGSWASGGIYFPIPGDIDDSSPVTALFVAHRNSENVWSAALDESEEFINLIMSAPKEVVSLEEQKLFVNRSYSLMTESQVEETQDVGLSLPYERNVQGWGHYGVHGNNGTNHPFNAIDFWGVDGRVLASRGGIAYKFCTNSPWPYIRIVHDNGWTTGYYHTNNQPSISNGQRINEGDFIGMTGIELPCGGRATNPHVHWTLWRGNQRGTAEAVDNKIIGSWVWHEGSEPYQGYAERSGVRINKGRRGLINYGHGEVTPPNPTPSPNPTPRPTPLSSTIPLTIGWNLISLPVQPSNTAIEVVLSQIKGSISVVYAYNTVDGEYQTYIPGSVSNLSHMVAGRGYWVYSTKNASLNISGSAAAKSITLEEGWNLVGYNSRSRQSIETALKSIAGKYSAVYFYDQNTRTYVGYIPGELNDLNFMEPGAGYWIHATTRSVWRLP